VALHQNGREWHAWRNRYNRTPRIPPDLSLLDEPRRPPSTVPRPRFGRNARTRGHHSGNHGFVGNPASVRNWPNQISSGQHRIRTCDLYGVKALCSDTRDAFEMRYYPRITGLCGVGYSCTTYPAFTPTSARHNAQSGVAAVTTWRPERGTDQGTAWSALASPLTGVGGWPRCGAACGKRPVERGPGRRHADQPPGDGFSRCG
jgi:hypothetical protein